MSLSSITTFANGMRLHARVAGDPSHPAALLLHGWPTSSFLWRDVMPLIAARDRYVIALDLPGFGDSDKPLSASYSFRFHARILTAFLDAVDIDAVDLAVHDLGGPIGLYWALNNRERVRSLALLNTLVYPRPSWAVIAFVVATLVPGLRDLLVSPKGLEIAMRIGIADPAKVTPELVRAVQAPFASREARRALLKSGHALHPAGFVEIARALPSFQKPVRILYGTRDRILPDVAWTMDRVARDLPQAVTTRFHGCGHFVQEERGAEIGALLGAFFASSPPSDA